MTHHDTPSSFALQYTIWKKLPSIRHIATDYGDIDLIDDPELREAVIDAVAAVLEFRLETVKEGSQ